MKSNIDIDQLIKLTNAELDFLKNYCPVDKMFTNKDEIEQIEKIFNLKKCPSYKLYDIRNAVVNFYTELIANATPIDKFNVYMPAMQSVTAVIDEFIYSGTKIF